MRQSNDWSGKLTSFLLRTAPLSVLTACASSIQSSSEPPRLNEAPAELTRICAQPVPLPERELTEAAVIELWLRDREALIECGVTKAALLRYYRTRDALLTGETP